MFLLSTLGSAVTLTNRDVYNAYLKHKNKIRKTAEYLMTLPSAPAPEDINLKSLNSCLGRFKKTVQK